MFPQTLELESDRGRIVYVLRPDLTPDDGSAAWYEPQAGGEPAQATGVVWVRFGEGEDAASRAADLETAGYRIERVPAYAPHGAFVRAEDAAASLNNLGALRVIEGIELVEPQLVKKIEFR
jgi:hypothetical protein